MKIALLGYGKMGKEIEKIALQRGHSIILKVDKENAGSLMESTLKSADVAIEFSTPATVVSNISKCFENNIPVVVGTTGWNEKQEEIKKTCEEKNQTLFTASNFSIGVNIFFKVNEFLAKIMNKHTEYDVKMKEIHHVHKLDSPSGTALTLASGIINNIERKTKWTEGETSESSVLQIHSEREGEVPGTHIINYRSAVDEIEISHVAHNRQGFAHGAVLAAEFIYNKKGVFSMDDLLTDINK